LAQSRYQRPKGEKYAERDRNCIYHRLDSRYHAVMARVYEEIVDFIAAGSKPDEVARFQPSDDIRERVEDLISRARTASLSPDETAELDHYLELEHIMRLVKARARKNLRS
jgi:hypothetical protein